MVDTTGVVEAINGGDFYFNGAGLFDLGGTVVADGAGSSLIASSNSNVALGSTSGASLSLINGATATFTVSSTTVIGGVAGESATVTIDASSSWDAGGILVVARSYDFATDTVGAGATGGSATITVNGTLTVDNLYVGQNGELNGSGTLDATTVDNDGGTINVGNSPGVLTLSGDLYLGAGTLQIELGGVNPGEYDLLRVGGTTQIGGAVIEFQLYGGFVPAAGYSVVFLQAEGGVDLVNGDVAHAIIGVDRSFAFDLAFDGTSGRFTALNDATAGASTLFFGSSGADRYATGAGDDVLTGGGGDDFMAGGDGSDWFVFAHDSGDDIIGDFSAGRDLLVLEDGLSIRFVETADYLDDGVMDLRLTFNSGDSVLLNDVSDLADVDVLILAALESSSSVLGDLDVTLDTEPMDVPLMPAVASASNGDSLHA